LSLSVGCRVVVQMDSLVSTAPSTWLKMEKGMRVIVEATRWLTVIAAILAAYAFIVFVSTRVFDLTWIGVVVIVFALRGIKLFCEGAMERIRQLSQLV